MFLNSRAPFVGLVLSLLALSGCTANPSAKSLALAGVLSSSGTSNPPSGDTRVALEGKVAGAPGSETTAAATVPAKAMAVSTGVLVSAVNVTVNTLGPYGLTGNTSLVRDPSIMREGADYYVFDSDAPGVTANFLKVRCSRNKQAWQVCGQVFTTYPAWVKAFLPSVDGLWAPDISFFNGLYHLYYAVSSLGSQYSAIGVATSPTLNPEAPNYQWTDHGMVLSSVRGDDFNAIDPNIFIDTDGRVWLSYGSYWSGVKQREIDPSTGKLLSTNTTVYSLGARPNLSDHPFEGASLIHHGNYYYLFASINHCCEIDYLDDDYQEIVGRSTSPHGPFVDPSGADLLQDGGTILLSQDASWNAPGGATAYIDAVTGESLLVFHAADLSEGGAAHLWLKTISWENDWPVLE